MVSRASEWWFREPQPPRLEVLSEVLEALSEVLEVLSEVLEVLSEVLEDNIITNKWNSK